MMRDPTRRGVLLGAATLMVSGAARAAAAPAVVELFTSQGCSSCPAADAFAAELVREPGVTLLTYHVDYWDYLGWEDTLGAASFSQRQYDYAKSRGDMDVYTPQMIVNGRQHFTGARHEDVRAAMAQPMTPAPVLEVSVRDAALTISVAGGVSDHEATVWLMPVTDRVDVDILKGENAGRHATYLNVVRGLVPAGMWSGAAQTFALPMEAVMPKEGTGCVVLLQADKTGPILAAATWGQLAA